MRWQFWWKLSRNRDSSSVLGVWSSRFQFRLRAVGFQLGLGLSGFQLGLGFGVQGLQDFWDCFRGILDVDFGIIECLCLLVFYVWAN